ncbi:MFS transporter [Thermocatellispora tengchongensis]
MVTAAASATSAFLLNLWLQQVRGLSPAVTSLILAPTVLIVAMGPVSARLIARYGPRAVTTVGLALGAVSMLLLSRLDDQAAVLCGLALFSFGGGMAFSGATVSALTGAPPGRAGVAGGLANTAMEIGPTAGLAGLVAVAAARTASLGHLGPARATLGGYTLALVVMAAVMILTALLFLITSRESRKDRS